MRGSEYKKTFSVDEMRPSYPTFFLKLGDEIRADWDFKGPRNSLFIAPRNVAFLPHEMRKP